MEITSKDDLNSLIKNEVEENTSLEYKDPESLNKNSEITKDVSAMANSNGGLIIYGLCEENKDHKPTIVKWLTDHQKKEKIEQVLQSSVTPKINLKMNIVENPENKKEFVLVVEVPKSDSAPHQDHFDKDKRIYWRRNGYTTRQMEHYEIEDLFFKRKRPILKLIPTPVFDPERTRINLEVLNSGKVIAEKTLIFIKVPREFEISTNGWIKTEEFGMYKKFEYYQEGIPFYPKIRSNIGQLYTPKKRTRANKLKIIFMITCKDMPVEDGELTIEMNLQRDNYTEEIYQEHDVSKSPLVIWDEYQ